VGRGGQRWAEVGRVGRGGQGGQSGQRWAEWAEVGRGGQIRLLSSVNDIYEPSYRWKKSLAISN
jgi:hypothetical protein